MADRKITDLATLAAIANNTIFTVVDPDEAAPADQNKKVTGATIANFIGTVSGGYTDQMARDAVGAMLADTDTIDQTYNSGAASMIFQVKRQMSIDYNASGIKLVNDVASPAANQFYGANGSGTRGWQSAGTAFNKDFGTSSGQVAQGNHLHAGVYEPVFSKNSAFNKNFGTSAGTVSEGNHNHAGVYEPVFSKNSAFNKNFAGTGVATTVARSDHNHDSAYSAVGHDHNSLYVKLSGVSLMASGAFISYASQANNGALTVGTKEGSGGTTKHAYIDFNVDNSTNIARVDLIAGIGANVAGFSAILNGADPGASYSLLNGKTRYAGPHTFDNDRDIVDRAFVMSVVGAGIAKWEDIPDVPAYAGNALKLPQIKLTEDGVQYIAIEDLPLSSPAAVALNAPSPILFDDLAYTDYAVTTHNFRFLSLFLQNPVNKRIVSVYRRGTAHLTDGDIYMVRSATGGGDWEKGAGKVVEVEVISNDNAIFNVGTNDLRNLFGGYTKNGRLIVGFVEYQSGADVFYEMWTMYSDDDGDTWSAPYQMPKPSGYSRWSPFGRIVEKWDHENQTNAIYFTFNMRTGATLGDWHNVYIWRSFDNGASFLVGDILPVLEDGVLGGTATTPTHDTQGGTPLAVGHQRQNEPFMVHLGGDYLLLITRPYNFFDTDNGGGYQYLSRDGGQTWEFEGRTPFDMGTKDWDVATGQSSDNYGSPITIDYLEYGGVGFVLAQVLWRETGTWYHVMARADELIENGVDGWDMLTYTVLKDDFSTFVAHGYGGSVFFSNRLKGMVMTWIVVSSSIQTPIFRWIDEQEMVFHVDRMLGRPCRREIELVSDAAITIDCKEATEVVASLEAAPANTAIDLTLTNIKAGKSIINVPIVGDTTITLISAGHIFKGANSMGLVATAGTLPAITGMGDISILVTGIEQVGASGEQLEDSYIVKSGVLNFSEAAFKWMGHIFQATNTADITRAIFNLYRVGTVTGNFTWYLYSVTAPFSSTSLPDTLLATGDGMLASAIPEGDTENLEDLLFSGTSYELQDGTWYAIVLYSPGSVDASNTIKMGANTAGTHDGHFFHAPDSGGVPGTWVLNTGWDLLFYAYSASLGESGVLCHVTLDQQAT